MKKLVLSGIIMLATGTFLLAQSAYQVKSFKMTVAGTPTLHEWASKVGKLEAKGKILANGDLESSGSKLIVLSDFGMEQPTALIGTAKVGKEVNVKFSVVMSSSVGNAKNTKACPRCSELAKCIHNLQFSMS